MAKQLPNGNGLTYRFLTTLVAMFQPIGQSDPTSPRSTSLATASVVANGLVKDARSCTVSRVMGCSRNKIGRGR
jgi:hypothetical protein